MYVFKRGTYKSKRGVVIINKRAILVISILIVFIFMFTGVDAVEIIEENIGEYNYIKTNFIEDTDLSSYRIKYEDKEGTSIIIIISEFDDGEKGENRLSNWMSSKINPDSSLFFNNNYIFKFSTDNTKNLMWSYNNFYVQIRVNNYFNLPSEIIDAYLKIYPSDCDNIGCTALGASDISEYENIVDLSEKLNEYRSLLIPCKEGLTSSSIKEEVLKYMGTINHISDAEFQTMLDECAKKNRFAVPSKSIDGDFKNCVDNLNNLLLQREDLHYTDNDVLKECILRDSFQEWIENKSNKTYSKQFFETLFEERETEFFDELKYEYEYENQPKMVLERVDGNIVKKLITRKENCTPSKIGEGTEPEETDELDSSCYEEEILEILPDDSQNETLATKPEIPTVEKEDNFFTKILDFMRSKLNTLNWFD